MCLSLTSVNFGNNVTSIGDYAFASCTALTSVNIPDSVKSIGIDAFSDCISLTSLTISDSLTSIWSGTFFYCTALTNVTVPDSVTSIGDYAFADCGALTSVTIGNNVTGIGNYAFQYCYALTSVNFGSNVTFIGNYAFGSCTALTSLTIPDSVKSIGNFAFDGCGLTSLTIPDSLTSISSWTFFYCRDMTKINVDTANPDYSSIAGVLYNKAGTTLIWCPSGKVGTLTVPESVISIGDYAFADCGALTSVIIGSNVTSIGDYAFQNCFALTSMTIPNSVTSIGDNAFDTCTMMSSISLGNGVMKIGNNSFSHCPSLTSVNFYGPNSPSYVGADWTLGDAYGLKGHAYAASNFPEPGTNFYGLTMGSNIPLTILGNPTDVIATPGNGTVTLSWMAPSNAGGSAIDYYIVYQDGDDVKHITNTSTTITGLTNGQNYSFAIAAHNSGGVGTLSPIQNISPLSSNNATASVGNDNTIYLSVGLALFLVAIIVAILLVKRNKKKV